MSKFELNKIYIFSLKKYKHDMKKRIKKAKTEQEKNNLKKSFDEGLKGFAKELMEGKYNFVVLPFNGDVIGIYTYKDDNVLIYPEWCKEVSADECKKIIDARKGKIGDK